MPTPASVRRARTAPAVCANAHRSLKTKKNQTAAETATAALNQCTAELSSACDTQKSINLASEPWHACIELRPADAGVDLEAVEERNIW